MGQSEIKKFNIRVYGIFLNENQEILLSDEEGYGMRMTKFPGGGMHFGEGTIECLKREAIEEFGQGIEVLEHFYTTDFFQRAMLLEDQQLISIYYKAQFVDEIKFPIAVEPFDFKSTEGELISFRYVKLSSLKAEDLTFPIDQHVVRLLTENTSK